MLKIIRYYLILLIIPLNLNSQENLEKWFSLMTSDFFEVMENNKMMQLENKLTLFIDDNFAINSISLSLIGRLAKKNSKEDLEKYQKAFLDYIEILYSCYLLKQLILLAWHLQNFYINHGSKICLSQIEKACQIN